MLLKSIFVFCVLFLFTKFVFSQNVNIDSAKYFEGKRVIICGTVVGTHVSKGEKKTIILNFDKPYPETPFSVVIFNDDLPSFSFNPSEYYKQKKVCVEGEIKIYKDKPEIIVKSSDQIKIQ